MRGTDFIPVERTNQDNRYADAVAQFGSALERLAKAYEAHPEKRRDLSQEIHFQLWRSFQARSSSAVDRSLNLDRLSALIQRLKPLDRQVIISYLEDLNAECIGEITGLSPANVAMRVHRIKRETMHDDSPGDIPRSIWVNQPTETPTMDLKAIKQRSRDLRAKTRRKLLGTLAGPLAVGFFFAYGMEEFASLRPILQPLFGLALTWSLAGLFFLNRGMWSASTPRDAGLRTGLEFCRREIERQREVVRRFLLWSFGPMLLAIGVFILALAMVSTRDRGIFPNGLPFLLAIVVWIIAYFILRLREQRGLQAEIYQLDDIEKANHSQ